MCVLYEAGRGVTHLVPTFNSLLIFPALYKIYQKFIKTIKQLVTRLDGV